MFNQFLIREAVRSHLYLAAPPIVPEAEVSIPRFSVLHLLSDASNEMFPVRESHYFKDVPKNKRIPIYQVQDLVSKEDTTTLNNRYLPKDIRMWTRANLKTFRNIELDTVVNTDPNTPTVVNYNAVKDLYKYKGSMTAEHSKFFNLRKTYWTTVKTFLAKDTSSYHFVTVDIPSEIPNYAILNILIKFNNIKLSRTIRDKALYAYIDLYKWFISSTRGASSISDITDEESKRVVLEFKYKGHSSFIPMYILRSLCFDSKLENKVKMKDDRVQKLLIAFTRRIQIKVNAYLAGEISSLSEEPENTESGMNVEVHSTDTVEEQTDEDHEDFDEPVRNNEELEATGVKSFAAKTSRSNDKVSASFKQKTNSIKELDKITNSLDTDLGSSSLIDDLIDLEETGENNSEVYKDIVYKAMSEKDYVQEEEEEEQEAQPLTVDYSHEKVQESLTELSNDDKLEKYIEESKLFKTMSSAEIRSLRKLKEERKAMKSPYNSKELIDDYVRQSKEDVELSESDRHIPIKNSLVSDVFKEDPIGAFDKKYIKHSMKKDIISCVKHIEKSNIIIKNYEVDTIVTPGTRYEMHRLTIKPFNAKESTVYFRIPYIDKDGEFRSGNIIYRMRKTRQDLPIRKISPIKVSLTSNYGKLFVNKTERKAFSSDSYFTDYIRNSYLEGEGVIKKLVPGARALNKEDLPYMYSLLSSNFDTIVLEDYTLSLDPSVEADTLSPLVQKDLVSKTVKYIGYTKSKDILVMDKDSNVFNYTKSMEPVGDMVDILGIDRTKLPKPFTALKVIGDEVPLGIVLGYYLGLSKLIAITNSKYTIIESNKQHKADKNELVLKLEDYKLILTLETEEARLLFNGFTFYKEELKSTKLKELDSKEVYFNLLESRSAGLLHLKELNNLRDLFIDPLTADVLSEINEPTEFIPLLLRANKLLTDLKHPDANDPAYSRIRGHDRVPGLMYRAIAESVREYNIKSRASAKIELDPYKVWNTITQDSSVKITEDINPILKMKENEIVTLTGADGLSKDAVPEAVRKFHPNEVGLTSEANVDSSDVGLNYYLSPYAKISNTRGLIDTESKAVEVTPAKALSSAALVLPMIEIDDPKRINMAGIQYSHSVPSPGYRQSPIRTEYEYIVPYRVSSLYCNMAKEDGTVTDITETSLTVLYKSGETEKVPLGGKYGRAEGTVYKHNLVTPHTKGSKVKANDYLTYNDCFFEPDWLDPARLVSKTTRNVSVALSLTDEVFEDSSAISKELANNISTTTVKEKIYLLDFTKNIIGLVKPGDEVEPTTTLFTLLEEDTDFNNLSESSIELLQNLASVSPKAKVKGVVDSIEVKYNGQTSDMSPTIKKLVDRLNAKVKADTAGTEYECKDNAETAEYRSQGKNLTIDTLELKIFIRVELNMVSGDKTVLGNQLKNTVGNIFTHSITTDSGTKVDAFFSTRGIVNRVVMSPIIAGTTLRLIKHVSPLIAKAYFE